MKLEEFSKKICEKLEEQLIGCEVGHININKNNGVVLNGIRITKEGSHISPTVYLENYFDRYEKGEPFDILVLDIVSCYKYAENKTPINVEEYGEFDNVKSRIVYKLINYEKNITLLKDTPHLPFLDLVVVFYYICEKSENSQATILIKNSHLKTWEKTQEEIFECAVINTPRILKVSIRGMQGVIKEILEKEDLSFQGEEEWRMTKAKEEMYVLTNQNGIFGAACLLYSKVLESFSEEIDNDFYVLPSSVHEVILVPKNKEMETKRLKQMVKEVNETEVLEEEILSNNVYYYSYSNQKFSIA